MWIAVYDHAEYKTFLMYMHDKCNKKTELQCLRSLCATVYWCPKTGKLRCLPSLYATAPLNAARKTLQPSGCRTWQPGRTWRLGPGACVGTNSFVCLVRSWWCRVLMCTASPDFAKASSGFPSLFAFICVLLSHISFSLTHSKPNFSQAISPFLFVFLFICVVSSLVCKFLSLSLGTASTNFSYERKLSQSTKCFL